MTSPVRQETPVFKQATITIHSIALGELEWHNILRALAKEWGLAVINSAIFGSVHGIIAWSGKHNAFLGVIAGISLFANMFVASTAGVMLPMSLRKLNIDRASIAGVFDTVLSDFMGFFIYLGLTTLLITKLSPASV